MKKIFTLILVAVATMVAVPASAQVQFGLKGGLNVTNMSLNDDILKTENVQDSSLALPLSSLSLSWDLVLTPALSTTSVRLR